MSSRRWSASISSIAFAEETLTGPKENDTWSASMAPNPRKSHLLMHSNLLTPPRIIYLLLLVFSKIEKNLIFSIVREKIPVDFYSPRSKTILTHKMWQAASDIVNRYQDMVKDTNIDYTSILPLAEDPR
jgi:hypothetical protein